ncbi:MAG: 4Fe-4S binding protein [Synergistaceae bacterium]|nr:4Fe-4S binding protein [Synergistaceae bacterium]
MAWIRQDRCQACGLCLSHCPREAIVRKDDLIAIDRNRCAGCLVCTEYCPTDAIRPQ